MAFTKVAPAGIGSTPGDGYRIGDSFLHSTGVEITNINATGIVTAASLDISGAIDFDGHTELDNVNVSGVSTFNDDVNVIQGKKINFGNTNGTQGHIYFDGSTTRLQTNHGLNIGSPVCVFKSANLAETMVEAIHNGAVKLWYDQSNHSTPKIQTTATGVTIDGTAVAGALDISGNIDVDGHTNLDNVSIAGVTTITGSGNALEIVGGLVRSRNTASARFVANNGSAEGYFGWSSGVLTVGQAAATLSLEATGSNHIQLKTNGDERLRITSAGNVGIGTNNPDTLLHLESSNPAIRITDGNQAADNKTWLLTAGNTQLLRIQALNDADSGGGQLFDFYRNGNNVKEFRGMKGGSPWFTINNDDEKVGIGTDNVQTLLHLKGTGGSSSGIRFDNSHDTLFQYFTNDSNKVKCLGLVAQEAETVCPSLVFTSPDTEDDSETGQIKETGTETKSLKYSVLYMKAIKCLQEAQTRIETLETKVAALEG